MWEAIRQAGSCQGVVFLHVPVERPWCTSGRTWRLRPAATSLSFPYRPSFSRQGAGRRTRSVHPAGTRDIIDGRRSVTPTVHMWAEVRSDVPLRLPPWFLKNPRNPLFPFSELSGMSPSKRHIFSVLFFSFFFLRPCCVASSFTSVLPPRAALNCDTAGAA